MSTRRPKVPKPAVDGLPVAPPRASFRRQHPESPAAERQAAAPAVTGKGEGHAAAAPTDNEAKAAARKPRQPHPAKPAKPERGSAARAAERQELAGEIRRGVGRPGPGPEPEAGLKPVPAKSFSGRLLALGIVMVVLTVLLAPSVRTFLQQRSDIAALKAEIVQAEETGEELQETLDRWEDPAYIKAQARERIFLVMPGETRYLVKGEHGVEDVEKQAAAEAPQDLEWVDALWDSVVRSATAP